MNTRVAASIVVLVLNCLRSDPVQAADSDLAQQIDRVVLQYGLGTFWGGVLVTRGDEIILARGYGLANEELDPITADSIFDIGSTFRTASMQ